jgi:hypothetical protein
MRIDELILLARLLIQGSNESTNYVMIELPIQRIERKKLENALKNK